MAVAGLHEVEELKTTRFDRSGWQLAKRPKERAGYWRKSTSGDGITLAYFATLKSWCDSRLTDRGRPKKPKRSRRPYAFVSAESLNAYREASQLR